MSETPVKWTAAGLTPAGNALQAALLGTGDGLTFTRAAAVDAEGVERLDLTLQAPCMVDGPKCRVPVLLTNAGVETGFVMTELRFYVRRVTDGAPTGEEVLYATVTDETGDPIPTAAWPDSATTARCRFRRAARARRPHRRRLRRWEQECATTSWTTLILPAAERAGVCSRSISGVCPVRSARRVISSTAGN